MKPAAQLLKALESLEKSSQELSRLADENLDAVYEAIYSTEDFIRGDVFGEVERGFKENRRLQEESDANLAQLEGLVCQYEERAAAFKQSIIGSLLTHNKEEVK